MAHRTLDDIDVKGRRVLARADLNVPMKNGVVTDTTRIERQAATIKELAEKGARVVVLSHFDRPGGKPVPSMSLNPLTAAFAATIGRPVSFAEDCVGPIAEAAVTKLNDGDVLLLENLLGKVEMMMIGGAMANTFLAAQGHAIGKSLAEPDQFDTARRIMAKAQSLNATLLLPTDLVVARELKPDARHRIVGVDGV